MKQFHNFLFILCIAISATELNASNTISNKISNPLHTSDNITPPAILPDTYRDFTLHIAHQHNFFARKDVDTTTKKSRHFELNCFKELISTKEIGQRYAKNIPQVYAVIED